MSLRDALRRFDPERRAADAVRTGGEPLDRSPPVPADDRDEVRVHTDGAAARAADEVDADAYTLGTHIAFAPGKYAPHTPQGRRLLAHELAHVVGQASGREPAAIARQSRLRPFVQAQQAAVTAAIAAGNYTPGAGSAFWILNGLSPEDIVDTLRALTAAERTQLADRLEQARGTFDISRLRLALESIAATSVARNARGAVASLDAVRAAHPPSATRRNFERAIAVRDWRTAYVTLTGVDMYELIAALDSLPRALLADFWTHRGDVAGVVDLDRITYAHDVALGPGLPAVAPGDLVATGQRRTASRFAAVTLLSVASAVNGSALAHVALILDACATAGISDRSHIAYVLASAHHESAMGRLMTELASGAAYEHRADLGNTMPGDGPRYRGRGYVQITGRGHYRRFGALLGVDLEGDPARAAEPETAARILTAGMRDGRFTGRSLAQFGADGGYDFLDARRIVNALDRAGDIAAIAHRYRRAMGR